MSSAYPNDRDRDLGFTDLIPIYQTRYNADDIANPPEMLPLSTTTSEELVVWLKKYFIRSPKLRSLVGLLENPKFIVKDKYYYGRNDDMALYVTFFDQETKNTLKQSVMLISKKRMSEIEYIQNTLQ